MSTQATQKPSTHEQAFACARRMRKKARLNRAQYLVPPVAPKPSHIMTLPFELIAEILMYSMSPRDILSVARSCKFFCVKLIRSSANYIWKNARLNCKPLPLPDPIQTFTESAYAALVFDVGQCEVCRSPLLGSTLADKISTRYANVMQVCWTPTLSKREFAKEWVNF